MAKILPIIRNELNRVATIRENRKKQGLSEEESRFLEANLQEGTAKAYDNGWRRWVE